MKGPTTITVFAIVLLRLSPASAQLVEAECGASWPGFPFPESIYLERAQSIGLDVALREFAAADSVRGGKPPAPQTANGSPAWTWHSDRAAVARTSDLGVFISRFNKAAHSWELGVSDGYIISAWAFTGKGVRKLIANTWLYEKNDRLPDRPQCGIRLLSRPGGMWSTAPRAPDIHDVDAALPPPATLRDADNSLIARATCRERWPPIIAASGEDHGLFLLPGVGAVTGGAALRPLLNLLPDEPVRWRRLKFLASRDGKLGLSIGKLVSCDEPGATQTYVSAWVRDGASWRLELLAIVP
jgi:hypothetical protein